MTDNKEDAAMSDKEDAELQQFCKDVGLDHTKVTNMEVKKVSELGDVLSVLEYDLTKVKNEFGVKTMVATKLIKRFKPTGNPTVGLKTILQNGLPELRKYGGSLSGPSENKGHDEATLIEQNMHVLRDGENGFHMQQPDLAPVHQSRMEWSQESGVQGFVHSVVQEVVSTLNLQEELSVLNELSVMRNRVDVWVLLKHGIPIGVFEVKKPSQSALNSEWLHGQVKDYMRLLPALHGLKHAFGVATTYEGWRFYWLEEESNTFLADKKEPFTSGSTGVGQKRKSTNVVHGSRVYAWNDPGLVRALCSIVYKMYKAGLQRQELKMFDGDRVYLCFKQKQWFWRQHPDKWKGVTEPDFKAPPEPLTFPLYALKDLGAGRDGHAWMCSDVTGRVFVVKFGGTMEEAQRFNLVNERTPFPAMFCEVAGQPAIVLPYMRAISIEEWPAIWPDVERVLASAARKGIVHEDLAVRHVGYLPNALSTVGIFDLAEVSVTMDETNAFERMVHDLQMDLRRLGVTMCRSSCHSRSVSSSSSGSPELSVTSPKSSSSSPGIVNHDSVVSASGLGTHKRRRTL